MKSAAAFQPEDHVQMVTVNKVRQGILKRLGTRTVKTLHYGGIFLSGSLLFMGQSRALKVLDKEHEEADLEAAPPLLSALAGACGGLLYGLCITPFNAYFRTGTTDFSTLTRGYRYTLPGNMLGWSVYFGVYTHVFGSMANAMDIVDDETVIDGLASRRDILNRLAVCSGAGAGPPAGFPPPSSG